MVEHLALVFDFFEHDIGSLIVCGAAPFHSDAFILLLILLVEVLLDELQVLPSVLQVLLLIRKFAMNRHSLLL